MLRDKVRRIEWVESLRPSEEDVIVVFGGKCIVLLTSACTLDCLIR